MIKPKQNQPFLAPLDELFPKWTKIASILSEFFSEWYGYGQFQYFDASVIEYPIGCESPCLTHYFSQNNFNWNLFCWWTRIRKETQNFQFDRQFNNLSYGSRNITLQGTAVILNVPGWGSAPNRFT